jgi:hypothetical protein
VRLYKKFNDIGLLRLNRGSRSFIRKCKVDFSHTPKTLNAIDMRLFLNTLIALIFLFETMIVVFLNLFCTFFVMSS